MSELRLSQSNKLEELHKWERDLKMLNRQLEENQIAFKKVSEEKTKVEEKLTVVRK